VTFFELFLEKNTLFLKHKKAIKKPVFGKLKMSCHVTAGGQASVTKWQMGEGGSKIGQKVSCIIRMAPDHNRHY